MRLNKAMIGGLAAVAATAGLIATSISPAAADPTRPYVAVGSDTIQDVWNGLTNDFGAVAPSIASWNAFVSQPSGTTSGTFNSFIQTKTSGNWFLRPSGSGAGKQALSAVWDPSDSHYFPVAMPPASQCAAQTNAACKGKLDHSDVDFARSSAGVGTATGTGLKYLPFARDAVAIAYNPVGSLAPGLNLTTSQITELYSGVDNAADSVITFSDANHDANTHVFLDADGAGSGTPVEVHPLIPQNGSGTRSFFLTAINVTTAQLAGYIPNNNSALPTGLPENDGSVLSADGTLIPFSAAQWIAQQRGKSTNTTTGLAMANINSKVPVTGSGASAAPGNLFGGTNLSGAYNTVPGSGTGVFNRDTYNIVPLSFISGTPSQQALVSILGAGINGANGLDVITGYGFGALSYGGNSANFLDGAFVH